MKSKNNTKKKIIVPSDLPSWRLGGGGGNASHNPGEAHVGGSCPMDVVAHPVGKA